MPYIILWKHFFSYFFLNLFSLLNWSKKWITLRKSRNVIWLFYYNKFSVFFSLLKRPSFTTWLHRNLFKTNFLRCTSAHFSFLSFIRFLSILKIGRKIDKFKTTLSSFNKALFYIHTLFYRTDRKLFFLKKKNRKLYG